MKINSGNVETYIPFLAISESDLVSRLTGLSAFTVYRSRNGGASVAMTTPTIVEDANIEGLYWLLVDEDTTVDAGFIEQQLVLHFEHATMWPVTMVIQLTDLGNRVPDALDQGFMKASTKRVGLTTLAPGGSGGQKYGGAS